MINIENGDIPGFLPYFTIKFIAVLEAGILLFNFYIVNLKIFPMHTGKSVCIVCTNVKTSPIMDEPLGTIEKT